MAPVEALGQHPIVVKPKEGGESENDDDETDGDDDNDNVVRLLDNSFVSSQFFWRIHLGGVAVGVAGGVAGGCWHLVDNFESIDSYVSLPSSSSLKKKIDWLLLGVGIEAEVEKKISRMTPRKDKITGT